MVAGATGIDLYLMTVAADDGVMPQTREHATVLRALGVETGVVAVTKSDLADPELAMIEASELLPGAEWWPSRRGPGRASTSCAPRSTAPRRRCGAEPMPGCRALHVDRVVHDPRRRDGGDRNAVVGQIGRGDELRLLPAAGGSEFEASRSTTRRSSARTPVSAWRSTSSASR